MPSWKFDTEHVGEKVQNQLISEWQEFIVHIKIRKFEYST